MSEPRSFPVIRLTHELKESGTPFFVWGFIRRPPNAKVAIHPVFNYSLSRMKKFEGSIGLLGVQVPDGYELLDTHDSRVRWNVANHPCPEFVRLERDAEANVLVPTIDSENYEALEHAKKEWGFTWGQALFIMRLKAIGGEIVYRVPFAVTVTDVDEVRPVPETPPTIPSEPPGQEGSALEVGSDQAYGENDDALELVPAQQAVDLEVEFHQGRLRYSAFDYRWWDAEQWPLSPSLAPLTWLRAPDAELRLNMTLGRGLEGDRFEVEKHNRNNPRLPGFPDALRLCWQGVTDPVYPKDPHSPPIGFIGSGTSGDTAASVAYRNFSADTYPQAAVFHAPLRGQHPTVADPTVVYDPPEEEPGG